MNTGRLEAFSDGVLAIVITIMVLELNIPKETSFSALKPLVPKFISYLLSFIYLGIYWNNHHHHFQAVENVNGKILWANLLLLFFLSLIPFTTSWMGESSFAKNPTALYGINLLACNIAVFILESVSVKAKGNDSIEKALQDRRKEYMSFVGYVICIPLSFYLPYLSLLFYVIVAIIWIIPDKRIEKELQD